VADALVAQVVAGQAPELVQDQRQQLVARVRVALANSLQDLGDWA